MFIPTSTFIREMRVTLAKILYPNNSRDIYIFIFFELLNYFLFLWWFTRWFERLTMSVILLNCVTLGMYQPCEDIADDGESQRAQILKVLQGQPTQSYKNKLGLKDRNMQVRFCLKVVLESWDLIFLGITTTFRGMLKYGLPSIGPCVNQPQFYSIFAQCCLIFA